MVDWGMGRPESESFSMIQSFWQKIQLIWRVFYDRVSYSALRKFPSNSILPFISNTERKSYLQVLAKEGNGAAFAGDPFEIEEFSW